MKQIIEGRLIEADERRFVIDHGDVISTYSTQYYRLPLDRSEVISKPILVHTTAPLPVDLVIGEGGHAMLVVTG